jgi:hypothetical protein
MADDYSWDTSIKELWEQAAKNPPDVPHYQKLVTLAQLKAAHALAVYTRWLMIATVVVAAATAVGLVCHR